MAKSGSDQPRASRWEIIGARLRIWTPPRDVEIPPVNKRAVAAWIAGIAVAAVLVVTLLAPSLDRTKARKAEEERRSFAAYVRRETARLAVEQRARHERSPDVARLHAAGRDAAARAALLADASASVGRDVRARVADRKLDGPIRRIQCRYRDGDSGARVHMKCLAITSSLAVPDGASVNVGHPFLVAGSLRDGRYAWCKENPPPGEGMAGQGVSVALPDACTR